jgi:hypothetical protein
MRNGVCWERTTPELHTEGNESGFWPTPKASPSGPDVARRARAGSGGDDLATAVAYPTPTARDWKSTSPAKTATNSRPLSEVVGGISTRQTCPTPTANEYGRNKSASSGAAIRPSLGMMAKKGLFPTPKTNGFCSGSGAAGMVNDLAEAGQIDEETKRSMRSGNGGQLNPDWVEWLMGVPIGWTSLEPLSADRYCGWLALSGIESPD